jgi:para-aminobenzoate synthetase component 1
MLAVGCKRSMHSSQMSLEALYRFQSDTPDWLTGYFAYDLKNELEALQSNNPTSIAVPHLQFVQPEVVLIFQYDRVSVHSFGSPDATLADIERVDIQPKKASKAAELICQTSRDRYLENVARIRDCILDGEFYEMNYCIEFLAEKIEIEPVETYLALNSHSPAPFSALMKCADHYILSASPERFLSKRGTRILSQPIKGTMKRSKDAFADEALRHQLQTSEKEQAENLMIVDLVRNDLARCARTGTVHVDELYAIYSYRHLHHLVSTISAELTPGIELSEIIKNTFPMGSMTGAPKIRVMQAIEELEDTGRGLYSGAMGFIDPQGDFDFNVVIRSLMYSKAAKQLSLHVGSAITYDSVAEREYEECLLKAQAIRDVLNSYEQGAVEP